MGNNTAVALGLRYLHAIRSRPLKAGGRQGRESWLRSGPPAQSKPGASPGLWGWAAIPAGQGKARREPGSPAPPRSLGTTTAFQPLAAPPCWQHTSTSPRASPSPDGELGKGAEHHLRPQLRHRWVTQSDFRDCRHLGAPQDGQCFPSTTPPLRLCTLGRAAKL